MDKSKDKFNKFIKEIEGLEDSYLFIQGTLTTNKTFNKVRIYNYINQKIERRNDKMLKRKIKKDKLNVIYWTVGRCEYLLLDINKCRLAINRRVSNRINSNNSILI